MKKSLNPFQGSMSGINLFCISVYSIFITLFLLQEGDKLVSFDLTDLSTVYYSEGTYCGVDIGLRVKWMYRFLVSAALIFLIVFAFLKRVLKDRHLIQYEDLLVFSTAGSVLCIMCAFGTDSTHVLSGLFFLFAIKLVLMFFQNKLHITKLALHSGLFNLSISFGFLLLFILVFLCGTHTLVHKNHSSILFIGTLLFFFYYIFCFRVLKINVSKATLFLLPLTVTPLISLLSVEYFFYKKIVLEQTDSHFKYFWILFVIAILLIAIFLFLFRKKRISSRKLYNNFIAPSLLFGYVIATAYEPLIDNIGDMFEPANALNSSLRVFEFGQIPVLDFVSSHMLSEQWYNYIYSLIFGFHNDLGSIVYNFLNTFVFVCVQYVLLKQLFRNSSYAVAFIFLFPFPNNLFPPNIVFAVIPLFFIKGFFEDPSPWKLFKILLACCLVMLWRIDSGVIALFGTAIFLPLMYLIRHEKISSKIILKGVSYFFVFILATFGLSCIFRDPQNTLRNLGLFYHYISGSQSHGHHRIYPQEVHQFYLFHFIYPLLAVAVCIAIIRLLRTNYSHMIFKDGYFLSTSLFLFILYIMHLQRGLVRHGFSEGDDEPIMSFFPVALAFFVSSFSIGGLAKRFTIFLTSSFALFMILKFIPFKVDKIPIENGITGNRFYNIEDYLNNPLYNRRVLRDTVFANDNYTKLKRFTDTYLNKDQTFLDLSNTCMLYYYCNRRVPGYFNQNIENTIDDHMHFELVKELEPKKVPMIIASSYPWNVNDAMDGVPNVMRHYILFEYLYTHYKPIGNINHKNIWVSDELRKTIKDSLPMDPNTFTAQHYDYNLIAEYLGYHATKNLAQHLVNIYSEKPCNSVKQTNSFLFSIPQKVRGETHCYLSVKFKKKDYEFKPYPIFVEVLNDSLEICGGFGFARRDKISDTYMLRLSNHYLWHLNKVSHIRITNDADIISIDILKDNRPEYKTTDIH